MCNDPSYVWQERGGKWEKVPVGCRKCKSCRANYVNDWIGRCMAEAATSQETCVLNMTYAPRDDMAEKVVTPAHFQLFMKRMRKRGHKLRYFVAGEYGEAKGRAHFHAILFFERLLPRRAGDAVPAYGAPAPFCREIPGERMVHLDEWPHGHVTVDWSMSERAVRYACWYVLEDRKKNGWLSMSKKPALGAAWFASKAESLKDADLLPRSFEYLPPGYRGSKMFLMTGATKRDYLRAVTDEAARLPRRKSRRLRGSMAEWVRKAFEKDEILLYRKKFEDMPLRAKKRALDMEFAARVRNHLGMSQAAERLFQEERLRLINSSGCGSLRLVLCKVNGERWVTDEQAASYSCGCRSSDEVGCRVGVSRFDCARRIGAAVAGYRPPAERGR